MIAIFISEMIWLLLVFCGFARSSEIVLSANHELVTVRLQSGVSKRLVVASDAFSKLSTDFLIPQCHSNQHNFTLRSSDGLEEETGSSLGSVIYGSSQPMTVINSGNGSYNIFCTYTRYMHIGR